MQLDLNSQESQLVNLPPNLQYCLWKKFAFLNSAFIQSGFWLQTVSMPHFLKESANSADWKTCNVFTRLSLKTLVIFTHTEKHERSSTLKHEPQEIKKRFWNVKWLNTWIHWLAFRRSELRQTEFLAFVQILECGNNEPIIFSSIYYSRNKFLSDFFLSFCCYCLFFHTWVHCHLKILLEYTRNHISRQ